MKWFWPLLLYISLLTSCSPKSQGYMLEIDHSEAGNIREITISNGQNQFFLSLNEDGIPANIRRTVENDTGYFHFFDKNGNLSLTGTTYNGEYNGTVFELNNGFICREYYYKRDSCLKTSIYHYDLESYFIFKKRLIDERVLIFEQQHINGKDSVQFIDSAYFPQFEYDYSEFPSNN